MAEQNLFCLCGRCSRKLRSAAARRVGMGSTCCRKETGKTITQLLKELDEQEAAAAAEQQEPDTYRRLMRSITAASTRSPSEPFPLAACISR